MFEDAERSNTVKFSEKLVFSESFKPLYREGMSLVEEAADYLDGEGRAQAKGLSRLASTLYAAESMRLTTRLMQVASWLLLQRAGNSGEMSRAQVQSEKTKIRLDTPVAPESTPGWGEMPERFVSIVTRSMRLQERVRHMDNDLFGEEKPTARAGNDNPVNSQITLLKTAFGMR